MGLSAELDGTRPDASTFGVKRLYAGPTVHYRDETDISGLVAHGGRLITNNPTTVGRHPVGSGDREQVTSAIMRMVSGPPAAGGTVSCGAFRTHIQGR